MDQRKHKGHLLKLVETIVTCLSLVSQSETFQEFRGNVFLPYVINQLSNVERVDICDMGQISPAPHKP